VALTGGEARRGEAVETSGAGTTEACWGFGAGGSRLDFVGERSNRPSDGERERRRGRGRMRKRRIIKDVVVELGGRLA
jgi:hypothetical protein